MLHCYCVDTYELCAISIKSEHLIVPFSNNLAVEFDLLKATNKIALEDFILGSGYTFFPFPTADVWHRRVWAPRAAQRSSRHGRDAAVAAAPAQGQQLQFG